MSDLYANCPWCDHPLRGAAIPEKYLHHNVPSSKFYDPQREPCEEQTRRYGRCYCRPYGDETHFSTIIGIEVRGIYDGVLYWQCPRCSGTWHRHENDKRLRTAATPYIDKYPPRRRIPGYTDYEVDCRGVVWSYKKKLSGERIKTDVGKSYDTVRLSSNGVVERWRIHDLVLEAFERGLHPGALSRHVDGNPHNNRLGNLAWGDSDPVANEWAIEPPIVSSQVRRMRRLYKGGETVVNLATRLKLSIAKVNSIVHRRSWKHVDDE